MPEDQNTADAVHAFVGEVAGIDGPVFCGWVSILPLLLLAGRLPGPATMFKPFELRKGRNVVARVASLDGDIAERVAGVTRALVRVGDLRGPMQEFLDTNFGESRQSSSTGESSDEWRHQVSYQGAVFRDGDSIAVIGRTSDHIQIGRRRVPIVTATAIGVPPKALRHAREVALALGIAVQGPSRP